MFWPVQQTFKKNSSSPTTRQCWTIRLGIDAELPAECFHLLWSSSSSPSYIYQCFVERWPEKNQTRKNKFKKIIWAQKTKMSGRNQPNIECRCRLRCVRPNWLSGSLTGAMPIVSFELSAFWGEHFWSIKTKQQPVQATQPNHTTLATDIQTMMFGGGKQWECITDLVRAVCIHVVAQCRLHILYL